MICSSFLVFVPHETVEMTYREHLVYTKDAVKPRRKTTVEDKKKNRNSSATRSSGDTTAITCSLTHSRLPVGSSHDALAVRPPKAVEQQHTFTRAPANKPLQLRPAKSFSPPHDRRRWPLGEELGVRATASERARHFAAAARPLATDAQKTAPANWEKAEESGGRARESGKTEGGVQPPGAASD